MSAGSVAEHPVFIVPVVELWPLAEDEGDAKGYYQCTGEEEGSVARPQHGGCGEDMWY